jgi:hypothetical protein
MGAVGDLTKVLGVVAIRSSECGYIMTITIVNLLIGLRRRLTASDTLSHIGAQLTTHDKLIGRGRHDSLGCAEDIQEVDYRTRAYTTGKKEG